MTLGWLNKTISLLACFLLLCLSYSTAGAEVSHGPSLNVLVKLCKHICNPATGETSEARLQDAIDRAAAHGLTYQRPLEARCWHAFEQASSSKETAATAAAIPALVSPNADDSANDPNVLAASGAEIIPFLFAAIDQPLALVQELSAPATPQAPSAATDLISPESNMVDSIVATGTDLKMTTTALARECWGGLCPEAWGANATNTTLQWQPISTSQANLTKRDAVIDTGLLLEVVQTGRSLQQEALQQLSEPLDATTPAAVGTEADISNAGAASASNAAAAAVPTDRVNPTQLPPVDVVYAWVNGTDPAFSKRFKQQTGESPKCDRVQNNNEIMMALLAISKHQTWINHVYIVVDQQTFNLAFLSPTWQQRVSFVDLSEFIPAKYLPTFNSHTFEACLYRIPGLAQHFIYLNDDMILSRPIDPRVLLQLTDQDFKFRVLLKDEPPKDPTRPGASWNWPRRNGLMLYRSAFDGEDPPGYDAHSAYFLSKAAMQKTWDLFGEQLESPLQHNKQRHYASLADGGDVHVTSLSQQVGVHLGLLAKGNPIKVEFVQHEKIYTLGEYVSSLLYGKAHVVCLQSLSYMSDAKLRLLCTYVTNVWCMSGASDEEQQQRCKVAINMCAYRAKCAAT